MFSNTPLAIVDTQEALVDLANVLSTRTVIGVDTESDSFHHYQEKVCLIQFSDLEQDYIVDPLTIDDMSPLKPIFSNPEIVKIFHGADYDVVCLGRDFDYTFRNIFDTMISAQMLGLPRVGLADLIESNFGHHIDKQYQRHDWAKRPLKNEHLEYARGDTHFLLALREILLRKLDRAGRIEHVTEECEILEKRAWVPKPFDPDGYLRIKGAHGLSDASKRVLRRLYLYRNEEAKRLDRPPFKVMPDSVLVSVSKTMPKTSDELDALFRSKNPMKRRHGTQLIDAVVKGLEDDFQIPKKQKRTPTPKGPKPRLTGRAAERGFLALKQWRNNLIASNAQLSPVTVASNATLKAIVHQYPSTLEELENIPEVRRWQVREYGDTFIKILQEAVPTLRANPPKPKPRSRTRKSNKAKQSE